MMRYVFLFLTLFVLLACGVGCATTGQDVIAKFAKESETRVYEVFGMKCPGVMGGVEKFFKKIPAVQHAEPNGYKKRLVVVVRPGAELNSEDVYDAIRRANFTPGKQIK